VKESGCVAMWVGGGGDRGGSSSSSCRLVGGLVVCNGNCCLHCMVGSVVAKVVVLMGCELPTWLHSLKPVWPR